jgi:hypothetical protein
MLFFAGILTGVSSWNSSFRRLDIKTAKKAQTVNEKQ